MEKSCCVHNAIDFFGDVCYHIDDESKGDRKMTHLIIVRHGNSIGNRDRIFIGQTDWGLSEIGEEQVRRTTEYLKDEHIDAVYSSDLSRAYNTALPIARERGLRVHKRRALREIYAGKWETQRFADLPVLFADSWSVWQNDIGRCRCDGGESLADLYKRIKRALDTIARENDGKTVLIGTHATVIRVMNCIFHNDVVENLQKYEWVTNASVSRIDYEDGKYTVTEYGYDEHLKGIVTDVACKNMEK